MSIQRTHALIFVLLLVTSVGQASAAKVDASWTRSKEPLLVVDPARNTIDVFVAGVLLERLPLRHISVRLWQGKNAAAKGEADLELESGRMFVIEVPPTATTRATRLVTLSTPETNQDQADSETTQDDPQAPNAPADIVAAALPSSYETQLDDDFTLVVTSSYSKISWWRSTLTAIRDHWQRTRGTPVAERPNLLILEAERSVAIRLHPLLRPGTRIALGSSEADNLSLVAELNSVGAEASAENGSDRVNRH